MLKNIQIAIVLAVMVLGGSLGVVALSTHTSSAGPEKVSALSCSSISSTSQVRGNATSLPQAQNATFLIIESDSAPFEGMNGSGYHLTSIWPVLRVYQNQTVTIHIMNCGSSEQHGFFVTYYLINGVTLQPGQSYTITFVATHKGDFAIYCQIFCAIHPMMQNGELIVS